MVFIFVILLIVTLFTWCNIYLFLYAVERFIKPLALGEKNTHQSNDFKSIEKKVLDILDNQNEIEDDLLNFVSKLESDFTNLIYQVEYLSSIVLDNEVTEESKPEDFYNFKDSMKKRIEKLVVDVDGFEIESMTYPNLSDEEIYKLDELLVDGTNDVNVVEVITDEYEYMTDER